MVIGKYLVGFAIFYHPPQPYKTNQAILPILLAFGSQL